ncbi:MAG: glucose-6-phosphate isomerase family protein [Bacillota bacterium]|jgi:glucose-6-phosphate isomerase|nr:glucose-6-phosphate isomerase [Candidatus Fermentithermobacillaceae bacterium]
MIDLSDIAGFPVALKDDGFLEFGQGVIVAEPEARRRSDMAEVLLYPEQSGPDVLYHMYRATGLESDRIPMMNAGLRYDITVIHPGKIGSEYIKTLGHYHPMAPGQLYTYPEVYQVLYGKAHFLMQKGGDVTGEIEDFVIADFEKGDVLLIPPFYGHVTVNPESGPLVMANWIARDFSSIYEPIRARKGMAYYNVEYRGKSIFMPNDSYGTHPKPRLQEPVDIPELGLYKGKSIYKSRQEGADLNFLVKPHLYAKLWQSMGVSPARS